MILDEEMRKLKEWKIESSSEIISISYVIGSNSCFNCYQDFSEKSTNEYNKTTGTQSFRIGQICPICKGTGKIQISETVAAVGFIKNNITEKIRTDLGISVDSNILAFIKKSDFSNIDFNNKKIEVFVNEKRCEMISFFKDSTTNTLRLELKGSQIWKKH